MSRALQIVIALFCGVVAIGTAWFGRSWYLREVSTYEVPVPVINVQAYEVLTPDHFEMREMPRTMASLPYYQSVGDMVGKLATVSLPAGLPVPVANARPVSEFRLADAQYEVVSIPVEPVSAVGGQIRIGDHVNIYQMIVDPESESTKPEYTAELIAGDIQVVDVRSSQGSGAGPEKAQQTSGGMMGSAQTEQVQILTLALDPGQVQTVLNAVADAEKAGGLLWTTLATP